MNTITNDTRLDEATQPAPSFLSPAQRSTLRAAAHALKPVVTISQKGLSPTVLGEIERCLKAHELIKIRVFEDEREARDALLDEICATLGAAPVQHIGKLLVIWRENPPKPPRSLCPLHPPAPAAIRRV